MIKRTQSGPTGGDCTALYSIFLDKDYTLEEFINAILNQYPGEWGYFEIIRGTGWNASNIIGYKHGILDREKIPPGDIHKKISCTRASGGWTNMDYSIRIKEE